MTQHTPTPWISSRIGGCTIYRGEWEGSDFKGPVSAPHNRVAVCTKAQDAALIVKAVNNHDALVKALREVCDAKNDPFEIASKALAALTRG